MSLLSVEVFYVVASCTNVGVRNGHRTIWSHTRERCFGRHIKDVRSDVIRVVGAVHGDFAFNTRTCLGHACHVAALFASRSLVAGDL